MQYFYRAHCTPEVALDSARAFFGGRGFTPGWSGADRQRFSGARGTVDISVEIEGGHYTRVTAATADMAESEIDRLAKRFLAELHRVDEPRHAVRGAY
jgi:hypothetical protein